MKKTLDQNNRPGRLTDRQAVQPNTQMSPQDGRNPSARGEGTYDLTSSAAAAGLSASSW